MNNTTLPDFLGRNKNGDISRTCAQCGKPFRKMEGGAGYKYCSRKCMQRSKTKWHDKPGVKAYRHLYYIEKRYGITPEQFQAMYAAQGGRCAICQKAIKYGGARKRTHLDHCHATGKPRGLLCAGCNRALAGFKDNPDLLKRAIEYLK